VKGIYSHILFLIILGTQASIGFAQSPFTAPDSLLTIQQGVASYYAGRFHNRPTASGEIYDMMEFTAAHKHLPFGTLLKVTNLNNGYQAIVRINDRLPKSSSRIIDLSKGVAEHLDMIQDGIVEVTLDVLTHQTIAMLKEHYDETPTDLRLRLYYEPLKPSERKEASLFELGF
jgi:rare lipoprotein A